MATLNTFEVLADTFVNEKVVTCFALLGDANMNCAAALADRGCDFIYVRDEHCAVAAAMAWSRSTGKTGFASVTCGPGVTQIATALPAAVRARIPLVIFAGEAPLSKAWYNQQIEQRAIVEACGARYVSMHDVPGMPGQIRDAFLAAATDQQVVVLGAPFDLQNAPWPGDVSLPVPSYKLLPQVRPLPPHPDDLANACQLLAGAQRIVIMAGLGAVKAAALDDCMALAEQLDALLATTLPARGAFCEEEYCIGIAGGFSTDTARRCLQQADLIVAVGCSLAQHNSDGGKLFQADHVLHIDVEPLAKSQGRQAAAHHLRCDAKLGVQAILKYMIENPLAADTDNSKELWRTPALAEEIRHAPADATSVTIEAGLHDPREVIKSLNASLPQQWHMVNSSGHCSYFSAQMPGRPVDRFLTIREFGAIGNGIAFAIGVATAYPDDVVVLFDGDGSLLMHIQELETIRRHRLKILICVLNDGAYGSEIHKLRAEGLNQSGAVFGWQDFARIAHGFELDGKLVTDLEQLEELVDQFNRNDTAAIWDFHVSDKVMSPVIRRSHH